MYMRVFAGLILLPIAIFTTGCDQVKPIKMPTDTTKEGVGLFTGEKGYLDVGKLCGLNEEEKSSCPRPDQNQKENEQRYEE
jgi:hypothetical protein